MLENVPAAIGNALRSIRPGFEKTIYAHPDFNVPGDLAADQRGVRGRRSDSRAFHVGRPPRSRRRCASR